MKLVRPKVKVLWNWCDPKWKCSEIGASQSESALTRCVPKRSALTSCVPKRSALTSCVPKRSALTCCVPKRSALTCCDPKRSALTCCDPRWSALSIYVDPNQSSLTNVTETNSKCRIPSEEDSGGNQTCYDTVSLEWGLAHPPPATGRRLGWRWPANSQIIGL